MFRGTTLVAPRLGRWAEAGLGADEMERLAPALSRLLARSRRLAEPPRGLDRLIADSLDLGEQDLPWAEALRRQKNLPRQTGQLLRFRLIHVRADISNAVAHPVAADDHEISRIIKDMNDEFKVVSCFRSVAGVDGLLWLKGLQAPTGLPHVRDILGQGLSAWAERQRDQRDWYRLHNELQMFLHLHPVNRSREQAGRPLINGLWCWGGGEVRAAQPAPVACSDDEELRGLLHLCTGQALPLEALAQDKAKAPRLVVWTAWIRALQEAEPLSLSEALESLDRRVIRPLLEQGQPIRLLTGDGLAFRYRPVDRFAFWRRRFDWPSTGGRA